MNLFRVFKTSRRPQNAGRRARRTQQLPWRPSLEHLEDRNLMSTIEWVNRGTGFFDLDGFNAVFGTNATTARNVVGQAIRDWQDVITNFNYSDGSNTFKLTVNMDTTLGGRGRGASAAFASKVDANHKPMAGTITLGAGDDGHGAGYFLDPTPAESSEFQGTLINAYAANATPGGPADGPTDLYTLLLLEMTHEMGIIDDPNVEWFRDPHHYLQDAHKADAAAFGELWTYTGPDVRALFTTDNSGSNAGNSNPLHTAEPAPGNVVTFNGNTYFGVQDCGNAFYEFGRRYLVSDLDALILQDSYGYTIDRPTFNNMYVVFDQNAGSVLIRGSSMGENIYPGQSDPTNDGIQVTTPPGFYRFDIQISNPVPGTSGLLVYGTGIDPAVVKKITIDAGDGSNSIGIAGVTANTSVFITSHGSDIVTLMFGNFQNIAGPVQITNATASTTLVIDASFDRAQRAVTITGNSISGLGGTVSYVPGEVSSVTLFGGSAGNTYAVRDTAEGTPVTLVAGRGNDTFTVGNTSDGLGDLNFLGGLSVKEIFGGHATLILDDRANMSPTAYQVHGSQTVRSAGFKVINYVGITNLVLDTGSGGNEVTIDNTPSTMATTINAGPHGDFVHAGSTLGDAVGAILGPLTINGQGGTTTFAVFNENSSTPETYTLTGTTTGARISCGSFLATCNQVKSLTVNGGPGGDHFAVATAPATMSVTINGANGVNTLTGPNAVSVWTIAAVGSGMLGSTISFTGMANLAGGTSNDTFKFGSAGTIAGTLGGGAGTDNVDYSSVPGSVSVNLQTGAASLIHGGAAAGFSGIESWIGSAGASALIGSNASTAWLINGPNAGKAGNVGFTGFESLFGGTGMDVFKFTASGSIKGRLDGGGAPLHQGNWLDYSGLTSSITVNLETSSADGVGATVTHIQNVHGGNGGNSLTGDSQGNILIGGSGNDTVTGGSGASLLIGDLGTDTIIGGSGGDILIGGPTSFDTMTANNEKALMGILAEWQSHASYDTRFHDINTGTGGGLNGTAKLNVGKLGATVQEDGAADTLTAAPTSAALDWFFQGAGDALQNLEPGEHINNNTPAAFKDRTVTSPIDEGSLAAVSGTVTEPDAKDKFMLTITWGDGTPTETHTFPAGSDGRRITLTHRYRDDGSYTIQLFWTDPTGPGNQATLPVSVRNVAPTVNAGGDATLQKGELFDRRGSFADPGTGTWTAMVDYGDGTGPQALALKGHDFRLHHHYGAKGTYEVVVTVIDDDGAVGTASFTIAVV